MSSFQRYCSLVKAIEVPIGKRYKSLRYAAERYSWLTHTSFTSVFDDLFQRHGLRVGVLNNGATLTAAAATLEDARTAFLESLKSFTRQRRIEKREGRRFPSLVQVSALYRNVHIGSPRSSAQVETNREWDAPFPPNAAPPEFGLGDAVVVDATRSDHTSRVGSIRRIVWHWKRNRWTYFLAENDRKIHTRYFDDELLKQEAR